MAVGTLEVRLLDAEGLKNTDFLGIGNIDPYVIVQYKNQIRESDVAEVTGTSPVWNQTVTFRAEYPSQNDEYKLVLKIMDKDTCSAEDFVGEATIYVEELLEDGVENGFAEMVPQKYNIVLEDQTYCGEIQVGVTFTLQEEIEDDGEEYGGWRQSRHIDY